MVWRAMLRVTMISIRRSVVFVHGRPFLLTVVDAIRGGTDLIPLRIL